jgi:hypothetical protein
VHSCLRPPQKHIKTPVISGKVPKTCRTFLHPGLQYLVRSMKKRSSDSRTMTQNNTCRNQLGFHKQNSICAYGKNNDFFCTCDSKLRPLAFNCNYFLQNDRQMCNLLQNELAREIFGDFLDDAEIFSTGTPCILSWAILAIWGALRGGMVARWSWGYARYYTIQLSLGGPS